MELNKKRKKHESSRERGGRPRAYLGPPRQSFSPAERYTGGIEVQPGWQK